MIEDTQESDGRISRLLDRALNHFNAGEFRSADALCCEILQQYPTHPDALHLYGLIAQRIGKYRLSAQILSQAIKIRPDSPLFHNNLGLALLAQGMRQEANHAFARAARLKPDYIDALRNLADSLEKANDLSAARDVVRQGIRVNPGDPFLMLTAANIERRSAHYEKVILLLHEALRPRPDLKPVLAGEIHLVLGQAYDRIGDTTSAFEHFAEGNRLVSEASARHGIDKHVYLNMIDKLDSTFSPELGRLAPCPVESGTSIPAFLIGFPRSGTTLLDQILSSHPALVTLEEKPPVDALHEAFYRLGEGTLCSLASLSEKHIRQLRQSYFAELSKYVAAGDTRLVVDKLPLNTWRAPLIWRTFPTAKFILAVRHPCDVCLSCFMQYFTVNEAMSNFFTLEDTAAFYAKVMGLWIKYARNLPMDYQIVRYEDLIGNLEVEARRIVSFQDIPWDDGILMHTEKAAQRKAINTPSYHQVTQPIYQHARYRWQRYESQLEPVMGILSPFIEYFGYRT